MRKCYVRDYRVAHDAGWDSWKEENKRIHKRLPYEPGWHVVDLKKEHGTYRHSFHLTVVCGVSLAHSGKSADSIYTTSYTCLPTMNSPLLLLYI